MPKQIDIQFADERLLVQAQIFWPSRGKGSPVTFILDTGSPITMLSETGMKKMGVSFADLKHSMEACGGLGGKTETFDMEDVMILFPCVTGGTLEYHVDALKIVKNNVMKEVHKTHNKVRMTKQLQMDTPSLLGMDFLSKTNAQVGLDFKCRTGILTIN